MFFTLPFGPGIICFRIGLLRAADESTVVECFNEGLGRPEYLVMIHELNGWIRLYHMNRMGGKVYLEDLPLSCICPCNIDIRVEVYR